MYAVVRVGFSSLQRVAMKWAEKTLVSSSKVFYDDYDDDDANTDNKTKK